MWEKRIFVKRTIETTLLRQMVIPFQIGPLEYQSIPGYNLDTLTKGVKRFLET